MERKNTILYLVIATFAICNLVQLFSIKKFKVEKDNAVATLYPYAQKHSFLQSNIEANIEYAAKKIEDVGICDRAKRENTLNNLFNGNNRPLFILRITDRYCTSCVRYFVNLFANKRLHNDIKFMYLTGFQNQSRISYEAKELGIDSLELYNVPFLDVPIDNVGYPYLMVLNKNLVIEYCYFPTKGYEDIDIENLNMIIDCYAKKYIDNN